eukprot:scaffold21912_cov127-Isochrysis_galbana.AAC.5
MISTAGAVLPGGFASAMHLVGNWRRGETKAGRPRAGRSSSAGRSCPGAAPSIKPLDCTIHLSVRAGGMLHAKEVVGDEYAQVVDVQLLPLKRKRRFYLRAAEGTAGVQSTREDMAFPAGRPLRNPGSAPGQTAPLAPPHTCCSSAGGVSGGRSCSPWKYGCLMRASAAVGRPAGSSDRKEASRSISTSVPMGQISLSALFLCASRNSSLSSDQPLLIRTTSSCDLAQAQLSSLRVGGASVRQMTESWSCLRDGARGARQRGSWGSQPAGGASRDEPAGQGRRAREDALRSQWQMVAQDPPPGGNVAAARRRASAPVPYLLVPIVKREGDAVTAREECAGAKARPALQLEQLLEDAADRPDVDRGRIGLLQNDLRSTVPARHNVGGHLMRQRRGHGRRALLVWIGVLAVVNLGPRAPLAPRARRCLHCPRQPKVAQLENVVVALVGDEDVGGLQVPVDAMNSVHVRERGEQLRHVATDTFRFHRDLGLDTLPQVRLHVVGDHEHVLKRLYRRRRNQRT